MFTQITADDRKTIEDYLAIKVKKIEIAKRLNKDYSTVCREIKRGTLFLIEEKNTYREYPVYKADYAQLIHETNASRKGRKSIIKENPELAAQIEAKILEGYTPEVALYLLKKEQKTKALNICFKTIYNAIDRKEFDQITVKNLPYKKPQKPKKEPKAKEHKDPNRRSIEERPAYVLNRLSFGHWEMDCVLSGQCTNSKAALLVLTERQTRFSFVWKMAAKTQVCVKNCLDTLEYKLKNTFNLIFRTITMDNGTEFINQELIENSALNENKKRTTAFYCHPYSACERGTNENYNRFIRRFIPKGSNIAKIPVQTISEITHFINNYPRKTFNFESSIYCLKKSCPILADLVINGN